MVAKLLIALVRFYRVAISPWTPPACRYTPSCSAYAVEALERHGAARGFWLALRRVGRCHPWGGQGYDPVPSQASPTTPDATGTHPPVAPRESRMTTG